MHEILSVLLQARKRDREAQEDDPQRQNWVHPKRWPQCLPFLSVATGVSVQLYLTYEPKYPKATLCLQKDSEELLAFFDFPAKHWQSLRTTNPIESTFATIRHRTKRSRGCLTRDGMLHMMFKLGQCAQKNWRRLRGFDDLAKVITGVKFNDGIEVTNVDQAAA